MLKSKYIILIAVIYFLYLPVYIMAAGAVDLPKTGQALCYDSAGTAISCTGTGQDGDLQQGISWPNPRFTLNPYNLTVTDKLTGLEWLQDGGYFPPANCGDLPAHRTWQGALDLVACLNSLNYLAYSDWRLPNVNELRSLLHAGQFDSADWLNTQGFFAVQSNDYWSSTPDAGNNGNAWTVSMWHGRVTSNLKSDSNFYVWPVRTGLTGSSIIQLPQTGSTACHDSMGNIIACTGTGQDGDKQAGVPWPNPRFTDNGDGTISDNLTGLEWTRDYIDTEINPFCFYSLFLTWQDALDYVRCFNSRSYLGHSDWRLPNINELMSLTHFGQPDTAAWLNTQGFNGLLSSEYWSSTTFFQPVAVIRSPQDNDYKVNQPLAPGYWQYHPEYAFSVDIFHSGHVVGNIKNGFGQLLAVRTGNRTVGKPDLVVSTLTAPNTAVPGQSITLSESTKNQGTAGAGASTTKYYWPANPNPILLGSRSVPALAAGATSSGTNSVTIPSFTCSGMKTIYIKAAADADGVIAESDETNNNKWRAVKMGPDLIIPTLTAPNNAGAGKTINISDTVKNNGGCTAGASTTKLYFSLDAILDAGDTLLGSRAVPLLTAGAASSGTTAVTIPAGTATGKYYIIAFSDADNVVAETFEGNNKKVKVINILPDLIVSILSAPNTAGAGAVIAISDTTKNIGGSSAAASTTSFYFSTDTILNAGDTLLGIRAIPALAAGIFNSGTTIITIPAVAVSGNYYIIGRSDADAVVPETIEGNNNKSRLITVP